MSMNRWDRAQQQRDFKMNMERSQGTKQVFQFRTEAMQALWQEELTGQISDGMWENTGNSGWMYWCNVQTQLGTETKLQSRTLYGIKPTFCFTKLIEYVGDRMLETIQKFEPWATEKDLRNYLKEINRAMRAAM